jgi:ATP-dependent Clp protease ATP-binding subunit ClpX
MSTKECSFCSATESEENPLIAGESVYICSNCVISAYKILFGEEDQEETPLNLETQVLYTPKEINELLNEYVIQIFKCAYCHC